jgi:hypothetical protein
MGISDERHPYAVRDRHQTSGCVRDWQGSTGTTMQSVTVGTLHKGAYGSIRVHKYA